MKKKLLFLFAIVLVTIFLPFTEYPDEILAARGCCMQRSGRDWYPNGMSFNQCREANQRNDRNDDLFRPSGTIWWNVNC